MIHILIVGVICFFIAAVFVLYCLLVYSAMLEDVDTTPTSDNQ